MSILIHGMELPTKCSECNFCVNGFTDEAPVWECACEATKTSTSLVDDKGNPFDFKPGWCPLEEVAECEDAVSRRRLLSDLKELIVAWEKYPVMAEQIKGVEVAIGYVETIPSVTPKQRTGKWIKLDMHKGMADHKCTACEQECYVPTCMGEPLYAFCPNCGADMKEETT